MSSDPASRQPTAVGQQAPHERRARIWLGGILLLSGAFLVGDTAHRLSVAWNLFAHWWPWALIGLAVVNLARRFLRIESLLAPGLLVLVSVVYLALQQGVEPDLVINFAVPLVALFAGLALLASISSAAGRSWTRVLLTGRVEPTSLVAATVNPRAFLCENLVDLSNCPPDPDGITMNVTVLFGHVQLTVPEDWHLCLEPGGRLLAPVRDTSPTPPEGAGHAGLLRIHVLGFGGVVSIHRA
ncbi:hypothetical protein [Kutzneria sp. CA-103260]|uniref:hypothetical protein n=1 Tax=Kutzneria sp. CA-103260 TaxID=2802641 RepID=UPI001BAD4F35|nr:hypothetical protein [Kutzneria sp. CA-103260]QUQ66608.1 hypothetical protein JJ691_43360 [Kutzneria sp. CA-103260]